MSPTKAQQDVLEWLLATYGKGKPFTAGSLALLYEKRWRELPLALGSRHTYDPSDSKRDWWFQTSRRVIRRMIREGLVEPSPEEWMGVHRYRLTKHAIAGLKERRQWTQNG